MNVADVVVDTGLIDRNFSGYQLQQETIKVVSISRSGMSTGEDEDSNESTESNEDGVRQSDHVLNQLFRNPYAASEMYYFDDALDVVLLDTVTSQTHTVANLPFAAAAGVAQPTLCFAAALVMGVRTSCQVRRKTAKKHDMCSIFPATTLARRDILFDV